MLAAAPTTGNSYLFVQVGKPSPRQQKPCSNSANKNIAAQPKKKGVNPAEEIAISDDEDCVVVPSVPKAPALPSKSITAAAASCWKLVGSVPMSLKAQSASIDVDGGLLPTRGDGTTAAASAPQDESQAAPGPEHALDSPRGAVYDVEAASGYRRASKASSSSNVRLTANSLARIEFFGESGPLGDWKAETPAGDAELSSVTDADKSLEPRVLSCPKFVRKKELKPKPVCAFCQRESEGTARRSRVPSEAVHSVPEAAHRW